MSQEQSFPGKTPPQTDGQSAIVVDQFGNAETEDSRKPQIIIHREQLSPERLEARIDLDKLGGSSGEHVLYIVLQDFGLPFRTITVNQIFKREGEDGEEETPYVAPIKANKVKIACSSRSWIGGRTEIHVVGHDTEEDDVILEPEEHMFFAHDGYSSDFRTGFIMNDAQIVAFKDNWKNPEEIKQWADIYTPIIRIGYEGNMLIITGYDDTNADVIYEKVVSQADSVIAGENTAVRTREQVLEVALARNKDLLIEVQRKLQDALFENDKLKRERVLHTSQEDTQVFGSRTEKATLNDPYGHCDALGINPDRLFEMSPQQAEKLVLAVRRVFSTFYHPDINSQVDPKTMGKINDSADKILTRIKTGSWGRN